MLNHLKDPATNPLHAAPMAIVGCEFSGATRQRLRRAGLNAWSCDLLEAEDGSPFHLQGDILGFLQIPWTVGIFHPPCTYLSSSGLHWNKRRAGRAEKTEAAVAFARLLIEVDIPLVAVENPVGRLSTRVRKPEQIIQPWMFGDDASKATCLWLKGLPPLEPTKYVPPRVVLHEGKFAMRWANQTDSGQNVLGPSEDRWALRSLTYPGIAQAFADQWAPVVLAAEEVLQ